MSREAPALVDGSCPWLSPNAAQSCGGAERRRVLVAQRACWVSNPTLPRVSGGFEAGQTDSSVPAAWTLLRAVNNIPAIKLELMQR